ncbi:MAG: LuxR C-terminal-related transcriptional regulator [Bacteroidota bacterium]|nr:LuxR C-terminal-related transcriptional regulator [Bacteroidota bacterium]
MKISGFILVVDSYLVRKGVIALLNRIQGVRVLKEFGADESFLPYLESHPVEFVIIGQFEFQRWANLFISKPELLEKTILLEGAHKEGVTEDSQKHEAHSSIHLLEDKEVIIRKIRNLLDRDNKDPETPSSDLSPRETTIVRLVSMGLTNRQIAEKLFLSAHTVMTHRKNINSKLGIKSVSGLTIYAIVNNIITIEEVSSLPSK